MLRYLLDLIKEAGGVKGILRLALYNRKFFKNWITSLIIAALSYTGIAKERYVTVKCVDNCVSEIPLMAFIRLLYAQKMNVIKRYDCCKGAIELINGVSIPIDEVANGDVYALTAPLRGWKFDKDEKAWLKHGVKFRHMYYSILEIFDEGAYEAVNCKDKDVIDVGAFVGDSAYILSLEAQGESLLLNPTQRPTKNLLKT